MRTSLVCLSLVSAVVLAPSPVRENPPSFQPSKAAVTPNVPNAEGAKLLARQPVAFVPNLGQWDHAAHHVGRFGPMTVFLEDKGWTFTLVERDQATTGSRMTPPGSECREQKSSASRGVAVRMSFVGASAPEVASEQQLPGRNNYFLGNDPSKWRSEVPLYGSVSYRQLYPGVDVSVRERGGAKRK